MYRAKKETCEISVQTMPLLLGNLSLDQKTFWSRIILGYDALSTTDSFWCLCLKSLNLGRRDFGHIQHVHYFEIPVVNINCLPCIQCQSMLCLLPIGRMVNVLSSGIRTKKKNRTFGRPSNKVLKVMRVIWASRKKWNKYIFSLLGWDQINTEIDLWTVLYLRNECLLYMYIVISLGCKSVDRKALETKNMCSINTCSTFIFFRKNLYSIPMK